MPGNEVLFERVTEIELEIDAKKQEIKDLKDEKKSPLKRALEYRNNKSKGQKQIAP